MAIYSTRAAVYADTTPARWPTLRQRLNGEYESLVKVKHEQDVLISKLSDGTD